MFGLKFCILRPCLVSFADCCGSTWFYNQGVGAVIQHMSANDTFCFNLLTQLVVTIVGILLRDTQISSLTVERGGVA